MTFRGSLVVASFAILACAGPQREARLREQLDAYSLPKPLSEMWPEALRYVNDRGYDLVGSDRKYAKQEEQGLLGKLLATGHETQIRGRRWVAETAENSRHQRYRLVGDDLGGKRSRIEFYTITSGDPTRGEDMSASSNGFRDVQMEIDFIEQYDVDAADRMVEAARGGK